MGRGSRSGSRSGNGRQQQTKGEKNNDFISHLFFIIFFFFFFFFEKVTLIKLKTLSLTQQGAFSPRYVTLGTMIPLQQQKEESALSDLELKLQKKSPKVR
jgi:hypothetical protein